MGQEVFQKLCQWTAPLKYASGQREAKVVLLLEGLKHMLIHDKDLGKLLCDHFELGIIQIANVLGLVDQFEEQRDLVLEILVLAAKGNFEGFSEWLLEMIFRYSEQTNHLNLLLDLTEALIQGEFAVTCWDQLHVNAMILQLNSLISREEEIITDSLPFNLLLAFSKGLTTADWNILKPTTQIIFSSFSSSNEITKLRVGILSGLLSLSIAEEYLTFFLGKLQKAFLIPFESFSTYDSLIEEYKFACKSFQVFLKRTPHFPQAVKECTRWAINRANQVCTNFESGLIEIALQTADLFNAFSGVSLIADVYAKEIVSLLFDVNLKVTLITEVGKNSEQLFLASKFQKLVSRLPGCNSLLFFSFFKLSTEKKKAFSSKVESDQPLSNIWSSIFSLFLGSLNDFSLGLAFDALKAEPFPFFHRVICENFNLFIKFDSAEYCPPSKGLIGVAFVKALLDRKKISHFASIMKDPFFHPPTEVLLHCFERCEEFKGESPFIQSLDLHIESLIDSKRYFKQLKGFLLHTRNPQVIEKLAIYLLPQDPSLIDNVFLDDYSTLFCTLKLKTIDLDSVSVQKCRLQDTANLSVGQINALAQKAFQSKVGASDLKELESLLLSSIKQKNFSLMYSLALYLACFSMRVESCILDLSCPYLTYYSCNYEEFRQWKLRILPAYARICNLLDSWPLFFTFYHSQLDSIIDNPLFNGLILDFCDAVTRESITKSPNTSTQPRLQTIYSQFLREESQELFQLICKMGNYTSSLFNECFQRNFSTKNANPIPLEPRSPDPISTVQVHPIDEANLDQANQEAFQFPSSPSGAFWSEFNVLRNHLKKIILFPEEELLLALCKVQPSSKEAINNIASRFKISPDSISSLTLIESMISTLRKSLNHSPIRFSPLLFCFSHLRIPGTTHKLRAIGSEIQTIASNSRPKRIFFVDEQGNRHYFLLKVDKEIHQESLVLSLFSRYNQNKPKDCMPIRTFGIFPIDFNLCLIEWIPHSTSCLALCKESFPVTKGKSFLKRRILSESSNELSFYQRVTNFTLSLATNNMFEYFLGIGDRHLDNILYSSANSSLALVDLTVCFGKGKALQVPEIVPFRLTSNFFDLVSTGKDAKCNAHYLHWCCTVLRQIQLHIDQYRELCPLESGQLQRVEMIEEDYLADFVLSLVAEATNAESLEKMFRGWFSHL